MKETGAITGISVAYSRATVDEIEAAGGGDGVRATVSDLLARDGVEEAFAIQTCNRSEAYVVTDRTIDGSVALESFAPEVRGGAVRRLDHEESLEHLMRVASGLESLVLGEDQIIGQLREAYEESKSAGGIGPVLKDGVTKALHVGERARNETSINEGRLARIGRGTAGRRRDRPHRRLCCRGRRRRDGDARGTDARRHPGLGDRRGKPNGAERGVRRRGG